MKDKNRKFEPETEEQKNSRWQKAASQARAFGRMCGLDAKKLARERNRYAEERCRKMDY